MIRTDFTPNNISLWIDNWKRKNFVSQTCEYWLNSFPFEEINVIVNHSSITIEDFSPEIRSKIKLWPNILRHDLSRGPVPKNINTSYIHTFLNGKKYSIFAHDNMIIKPGWHECIINTDYDLYMAPQGDQVVIQTLEGFKTFGWWDERYSTDWFEIDYICRAFRKAEFEKKGKFSVYDLHSGWPSQWFENRTSYNSVGLENFFTRADKSIITQTGPKKSQFFQDQAEAWNNTKWRNSPPCSFDNVMQGPTVEEINWYPWIKIDDLETDICHVV